MKTVRNIITIDGDTGEILGKKIISPVSQLKINLPPDSSKRRYICVGSKTKHLNDNHLGFFVKICHEFLHYDTTLLYRRGIGNEMVRLSISDISSVLGKNKKTVYTYLRDLVRLNVLIKPDNQIRYFVNPLYLIRGFAINIEEFHMLLKHDPQIIDCLDWISRMDYKNYLYMMSQ
tara:strand:+ start:175 stop:699 length:525 start_codon:yes stop_codon:yes gene_type:complete